MSDIKSQEETIMDALRKALPDSDVSVMVLLVDSETGEIAHTDNLGEYQMPLFDAIKELATSENAGDYITNILGDDKDIPRQ